MDAGLQQAKELRLNLTACVREGLSPLKAIVTPTGRCMSSVDAEEQANETSSNS